MARNYSSPLREAEAARTRTRIINAAGTLFSRHGYNGTTMRDIAREAGVSVQSVRLAGTKASLLIAAFETAFAGDEWPESLSERVELREIMCLPSTEEALSRYLDYIAEANRRSAALSRAMQSAAEVDSAASEAVDDLWVRRRHDMRIAIDWTVSRGLLTADTPEEIDVAAAELSLIVGPEAHLFFTDQIGWNHDRYRWWLGTAFRSLLQSWRERGALDASVNSPSPAPRTRP